MKLGDFEVIVKRTRGGSTTLEERFNYAPVIGINSSAVSFTDAAMRSIRAKIGSEIIYAIKEGDLYLAVRTGTINVIGFSLQSGNSKAKHKIPLTVMPTNLKGKVTTGYYRLEKPFFSNGLDWFKAVRIA